MALKSSIAREFRTKFPKTPTLTLARRMYNENAEVFKDVEDARSALRYVEGKRGSRSLKDLKDKSLVKKEARPYNPFKLPESHIDVRKPFVLPKSNNNVLLFGDCHIPYHHIDTLNTIFKFGVENEVNTIFINGDLIDFHKISRFQADPRKRDVHQELEAVREFLASLRATFPKADIYWLKGNHDNRYEHYLVSKAPELLGVDDFELKSLCRLAEHGVQIIDDKVLVKISKLSVTHGHLILKGIFAPVNSARGVYTKAKQSTLVNHVHKVSEHSEVDMDGNLVTCFSCGCTCELSSDYNPLVHNNSHGFAHIRVESNGHYKVRNYRILNGEIL